MKQQIKSGGNAEEVKKNIKVKYFRNRIGNWWTNVVSGKLSNNEKCNKSGHNAK